MGDKMVEIECLACRKAIKPRQLNDTNNYDTENYDGQIVCQKCKSLLYVKSVKGKVQKSKVLENKSNQKDQQYNVIVQSEDAKKNVERLLRGERPKQIQQEKEEREGNTQ